MPKLNNFPTKLCCGVILLATSFFPLAQCLPVKYYPDDTIIGRLLMEDNDSPISFSPYDSNYIIYSYTSHLNSRSIQAYEWANHARKDETKFQLSLGFPIYRGIFGENSLIGASYTQRSWWQSLNTAQSSPFRETNYEPQIFMGFLTGFRWFDFTLRELEFGFNHQSNGRSQKTSRSWNRAYFRTSLAKGNFRAGLKVWYRLSSKTDDNPLITHYLGHYKLSLGYILDRAIVTLQGHYNWNTGYGNAELGFSYRIAPHLRLYTQLFSGYGESLIDYDYKQTRIGAGIMLNDIF